MRSQSLITSHCHVHEKSFKATANRIAAEAIFADGRPFGLFESPLMKQFLRKLNPTFDPPDRKAVAKQLPSIYRSYKETVQSCIDEAPYFNVIFDGSDNITSHRVINISVEIPGSVAFYWKTFDTSSVIHSAENCIQLVLPELEEICHGKFSRINAFCTDTASVMRKTHTDLARMENFCHCFFSLCDSHGLQLLVKDILHMEYFKDISDDTAFITTFFKKSKLQLARLRNEIMEYWGHVRSFITACLTRWGTNFKAIESVQRAHRPLQRYARRPDVLADSEKSELKLLPTLLSKINDPLFWHRLDIILAILEPVCKSQVRSEADRANVGHVIPRWFEIVAEWQKIEAVKQFPDLPWFQLYNLHHLRMTKQTYDLHFAAYALRPDTVKTPLTPEYNTKAIHFLETVCSQEDFIDVVRDFNNFRARAGGHFGSQSLLFHEKFTPLDAWRFIANQGSLLGSVAVRVFTTICNSVPSERSFSAVNWIHSKARNRLLPVNADMLAFIFMNSRVLQRLQAKDPGTRSGRDTTSEMGRSLGRSTTNFRE